MVDAKLPTGRWSRLAGLARAGASTTKALLSNDPSLSADRAAAVLGQLRGLATKVGQMASYVDGLVPEGRRESFQSSMASLRASASAAEPAEVRATVERELNQPLERVFAEWVEVPLASASIGQVHRARLHDGRVVAVKVQHTGIVEAMESDLRNTGLLDTAARALGMAKFEVGRLLEEAKARFREELDYELEGRRLQAFVHLHAHDPKVVIPEVVQEASTRRVLTTELLDGHDFDWACGAAPQLRADYAQTLWRFAYGSIMCGRMFNADPHPGNFHFFEDGRIGFLDFGCVQEITPRHRAGILRAHRAAGYRDRDAFAAAVSDMLGAEGPQYDEYRRLIVDYMHHALSPVFSSPFRITREFSAGVIESFRSMGLRFAKLPKKSYVAMPPGILFLNRLQFGFYSILARLDVEVDYAEVEQAFLERATDAVRADGFAV